MGIRGVLTLITCVLASSLAFIDSSVVNVGLPAIGRDMGGGHSGLQWLIGGYLLPLSALLLLGGSLGDRFGRRRVLILGMLIFGVASVVCGLAPDLATLITARFAQGMGAALLMPNSLAILGASFEGEKQGRAIGIWAAAAAGTGAGGPILGGWLIDTVSWRMIFFINIPLASAAIYLAWKFVENDPRRSDDIPLDWLGALLATVGLGAITWSLISVTGPESWSTVGVVVLLIGSILLAVFLYWEHLKGSAAMMPLALFGSPGFTGLTLLTFLLYGALGCLTILLPYVLIVASGYSSTQAGAALLPIPLVLAAASPWLGGLAGRYGTQPFLIVGPCIVAAGFLLLLRMGTDVVYWRDVLPALGVIAVGLTCAVAPLTTAIFACVDKTHTGSASGLNNAIARTGGLVATALLGNVLAYQGDSLPHAFHWAVMLSAMVCAAAGACALVLWRPSNAQGK
ncbi:MAG: Drug resistance transporter EmrB/QacA subfamily [Pseudomonas sp.]|uniref:MFS transporter n=1 Tax=Pseudomonas sp. TaxID=306 RepID=UPI00262B9F0A|nr:MFS transporter [Pseudomonas sp.]MDB6049729.1 Drug resistance transporter EmrB/QacA subfamily [Pseudomonas sp.]